MIHFLDLLLFTDVASFVQKIDVSGSCTLYQHGDTYTACLAGLGLTVPKCSWVLMPISGVTHVASVFW